MCARVCVCDVCVVCICVLLLKTACIRVQTVIILEDIENSLRYVK